MWTLSTNSLQPLRCAHEKSKQPNVTEKQDLKLENQMWNIFNTNSTTNLMFPLRVNL